MELQWCLITLDGNATILQLRGEDFEKYLRMNLASLVGKSGMMKIWLWFQKLFIIERDLR